MTTTPYAKNTTVPVGRSRDEIEHTLERFGASQYAWMRDSERNFVTVAFQREGIAYRLTVGMPEIADFRLTPKRQVRSQSGMESEHAKETRRRFRALGLYLKAILEASETGIIDARTALVGHMLLPSGETVAEYADIEIGRALAAGQAPRLTLALNPPDTPRELTEGDRL